MTSSVRQVQLTSADSLLKIRDGLTVTSGGCELHEHVNRVDRTIAQALDRANEHETEQ